jgi:hypothetical protein
VLLIRLLVQVSAAGLTLGLAGCGGDDQPKRSTTPNRPAETAPAPEKTPTQPGERSPTETAPPSPEDQPGGAGDEEPIRSEARVTGRGGRIAPRVVRVPPFIAVRLELRSGDGRSYGLRVAGEELRVGPGRPHDSALLEGLGAGERYVARPIGAGNKVKIEATAEPGP